MRRGTEGFCCEGGKAAGQAGAEGWGERVSPHDQKVLNRQEGRHLWPWTVGSEEDGTSTKAGSQLKGGCPHPTTPVFLGTQRPVGWLRG